MGDSVRRSRNSVMAAAGKEFPKRSLVAAIPRAFQQTIYKNVSFASNGTLQNAAVFLLKVAVLEVVRRASKKANCPHLWNALQALQCFCYPPLKWFQRWAPFKELIKAMQMLSRPLLVLTIAEAITDQSESKEEAPGGTASNASSESQSEPQMSQSLSDIRIEDEAAQPATSQDWLKQLYEELEKQRLSLPERLNEDELHRFYRVSNGDFTSLLSSVKKTIHWRETYRILSEEELETWSSMKLEVFNGTVPSLVSTTYSWTKISSIIYLDQPVGTGFSYSRTQQIASKSSDLGEVKRIHEFLHKWLNKHQEFSSNPFYVGGDSYSGMVVPALVQEISKGNYVCCNPPINLQGYVLGNPSTEVAYDYNHRIPYAHGMALISDELYESMKRICKGEYKTVDPSNTECLKLIEEYNKCVDEDRLNFALILTPVCEESENTTLECYTYRYVLAAYWTNDESVRKALQIHKESKDKWVRCNWELPYTHDIKSSVPYHMNNSINGYRSLIYNGDHDMFVPYLGTQAWIRSLNYSIIDDWRPWMISDQIAGYTRTYANKMTYATIKGGGHTIEYKPEESYIMFQRWISGQPL